MGSVLAIPGKVLKSVPANSATGNSCWTEWLTVGFGSTVLPIVCTKWSQQILLIKDKVDTAEKVTEMVVEGVEHVAEEVAEVADEVVQYLPPGSKLQSVVSTVETVAKEIAMDAHLVDQFIKKVEEAEEEIESVIEENIHEYATKEKTQDNVAKDGNRQQ